MDLVVEREVVVSEPKQINKNLRKHGQEHSAEANKNNKSGNKITTILTYGQFFNSSMPAGI